MTPRIAVIVNPAAGGRANAVTRRLGAVDTRYTRHSGHATELTRELLRAGFDRIVAAGGDGTVNEIVNGFFDNGAAIRTDAALAVLPLGTGGDFRRSLGIRSVEDAIGAIRGGRTRTIDLGSVTYDNGSGAPRTRYFANVVSFGMGGEVAARSKNPLKALGGKTAFLYATVEVLLRYRAKTIELELDGAPAGTHTILNVAVGNGRFHGGGMHVCPRAALDSGQLEVTVIDALSMVELLRDIRVLYSDNLYVHPKTHRHTARRIAARSAELVSIEVDGEPLGRLPLEIDVVPAALQVCVPDR